MTSTPDNLFMLFKNHRLFKMDQWASSYDYGVEDSRVEVDNIFDADVVTSAVKNGLPWGSGHRIMLDIDIPAYLIESSTPGHSHLYIDKVISEKDYFDLLDVLDRCGIIEPVYASASKAKGFTTLRLPWVEK